MNADPFQYFRVEAIELIETLYAQLRKLEAGEDATRCVKELKRAAHSLKGAARLMELFKIGDLAHGLEDIFSKEGSEAFQFGPEQKVSITSVLDKIQEALDSVLNPTSVQTDIAPVVASKPEISAPPPIIKRAAAVSPHAKEPVANSQHHEVTRVDNMVLDQITRAAAEVMELGEQSGSWLKLVKQGVSAAKEMKDGTERTDALTELSNNLNALEKQLEPSCERLAPIGKKLHRLALNTKVVSVEENVHRYEKIIRDTCTELHKEARLIVVGSDLKIDRKILQKLSEPLAHLLRNSVFHGIEKPEVRIAKGKHRSGTVQLSFIRVGELIRIILEDDGAGLNTERIQNAAKKSSVKMHSPAAQSDVTELIWQDGISTAETVSQVAGRGVGLSVVRQAAAELRGTVSVESEDGQSCKFIIEVPSSVDIVDVFVVRHGSQCFLLPLSSVVALTKLHDAEIFEHAGYSAITFNEKPVRLIPAKSLFGQTSGREVANQHAVIFRSNDKLCALTAGEVASKQRVVVKALDRSLKQSSLVAGAAIMSDGTPAFLLSPTAITNMQGGNVHIQLQTAAVEEVSQKQSVLVVDDSLTTRMLEKAILETAGYETTLAQDGNEALKLLEVNEYKLIIVDFEMPNLDGMEMTRALRAMPEHADTPVIMLTSRGSDEDKKRGLHAGVQAYLVKGRFDQTEFLSTVRGLLGSSGGTE